MAPTATCVEDTGRPRAEASSTVIAAESATQKARTSFILVIFSPTMRMRRGPKQGKADGDADGADAEHPKRQRHLRRTRHARIGRCDDGGERPDGVGDIVGAMGEGQQARGDDQRQPEQAADMLHAVFKGSAGA